MSSFSDSLKYVNRVAARVATDADLHQSLSLIDPLKYTERHSSRHIKKVPYVFHIADRMVVPPSSGNKNFIVYQLNYSFPYDFYIIKHPQFLDQDDQLIICDLFVRYRIGTIGYRYHFGVWHNNPLTPEYDFDDMFCPQYTNQLIKKNFVMEIWIKNDAGGQVGTSSAGQGSAPYDYTTLGLRFESGLVIDPSSSNELEVEGSAETFIQNELKVSLPILGFGDTELFNFDPLGPWLNNT